MNALCAACLVCAAIPAGLFAMNIWLFQRPGRRWNRRLLPPVSVLIPARNEQLSIAAAIEAVLASRGVEVELVVLDDGSTDRTAELVTAASERDSRVRLEMAPPLPDGWNGKQHACWALAQKATHDVFCFLDADVRVGPEAIYRMVSELNYQRNNEPKHRVNGRADRSMVSGFPREETGTFLERLLLPLIHFVLLGFLPLAGERRSGKVGFAAGCGQFMMVRRAAYFASGGHSAIRASMHDGLLLPQLFRRHGFRTSVYDLSRDAACRMYQSAREVWGGLAKNATEGMASPRRISVFTVLLVAGQVLPLPLAIVFWSWAGTPEYAMVLLALALGYGMRAVCAWRYGQSWIGVLLHPLGVMVLLVLQWYALVRKLTGRPAVWKQRECQVG